MNGRWLVAAAFVLSVGAVACGGGGGGGGGYTPPSGGGATPTAAPPTAAPPTAPPPPVAATCNTAPTAPVATPNANQFTFTGTLTQKVTYNYPATVTPTTSPIEPPTCTVISVTALFSSGLAPDPSGNGGSDLNDNELDASALQTVNISSDAWSSVSGSNTVLDATQVLSPVIATTSTTIQKFTTPPVIGQAATGTFGATNSDAGTLTQNTNYGLAYTRTIGSAGAYSESGTAQNGAGATTGTIAILEATNGSGSITGPNPSGFAPKTFSAPTGGIITLTINPGPTQSVKSIPVWFTTPPAFYAENNSITAVTAEPSPCTGVSSYKVERVVTQLDAIMGYSETTTYDTYDTVAGNGADCVAFSDTLNSYYDWSGDIFLANRFSTTGPNNPLAVTTTIEVLALRAGTGKVPFATHRALTAGASGLGSALSAAAAAHFDAILAQTRQRVLAHALHIRTNTSGGL